MVEWTQPHHLNHLLDHLISDMLTAARYQCLVCGRHVYQCYRVGDHQFKLFSSFIDVADGLPKTCFNVRTSGGGDGYYILDPEQDGLDPISVFCNVSRTPVTAVLHHNQENWTHVHGYEDVGSYNGQVRHVTNAGLDGNNSHVILLLTCNNFI